MNNYNKNIDRVSIGLGKRASVAGLTALALQGCKSLGFNEDVYAVRPEVFSDAYSQKPQPTKSLDAQVGEWKKTIENLKDINVDLGELSTAAQTQANVSAVNKSEHLDGPDYMLIASALIMGAGVYLLARNRKKSTFHAQSKSEQII